MKTMGRKISTAIALLIFAAAWIPNVAKAQVKLSDDDYYVIDNQNRPVPVVIDSTALYLRGKHYFGFRGGYTSYKTLSDNPRLNASISKAGISLGAVFGQLLYRKTPIYLETGLMFIQKGGKAKDKGYINYRENYLEVPAVFKYMINVSPSRKFNIQPLAGAYMDFRVSGSEKTVRSPGPFDTDYEKLDILKNLDFGVRAGCGVNYGNIYAEFAFTRSFFSISSALIENIYNQGFNITLGVNF